MRDPISRNISSFFQNLETLLLYDYRAKLKAETPEAIAQDLRRLFFENFLTEDRISRIDANPLTWLDEELKNVFQLDVFQQEFPKEKGYEICNYSPSTKLLLIRLDTNKCWMQSFQSFLGSNQFALSQANTGNRKAYSAIYETFLKELQLPSNYVENVYRSRYSRHFYTDAENAAFIAKWTK